MQTGKIMIELEIEENSVVIRFAKSGAIRKDTTYALEERLGELASDAIGNLLRNEGTKCTEQ